ncbi:hypothetical protein [Actinomadura algeriensis]|uniref:Uncharacterized protein n=1 Tax=Actinomadura algeriensis TaxID=1679523 RepID=A0ABR9JMU2_9ACTN|nr:hypothetical protein [Actinomadura algeriensis]MBE1531779.1 hypothetical protein [Actinomadura algeriensis]
MEGVVCGACVQVLALIVALLGPSAQPLARVVEPAHVRGCLSSRASGEARDARDADAPRGDRPSPALHAMSAMGNVKGTEFKLSFYRGVGGGLRVVTTDRGVSLTFEGGIGIGGSFSAGTAEDLPKSGPAAEGRVSLNARGLPVRPPDFGVTLDPDGRLQGYTDVKAGNYRTRFHGEPFYLTGEPGGDEGVGAPVVRRSWSFGTEFKIAIKYTFQSAWKDIVDLLARLARYLPTARFLQIPLSRPVDPYDGHPNVDQPGVNRALGTSSSKEGACRPASVRTGTLGLLLSRSERRTCNARTSRASPRPKNPRPRHA